MITIYNKNKGEIVNTHTFNKCIKIIGLYDDVNNRESQLVNSEKTKMFNKFSATIQFNLNDKLVTKSNGSIAKYNIAKDNGYTYDFWFDKDNNQVVRCTSVTISQVEVHTSKYVTMKEIKNVLNDNNDVNIIMKF